MANSTRSTFPIARLSSYLRFRVACFQGVHVSQYEISGPVGLELFLILSFDDGEGAEDVISVFAGDPIKVEVQGVEPGPEVSPFLLVPYERRSVVSHVLGEGFGGWNVAQSILVDVDTLDDGASVGEALAPRYGGAIPGKHALAGRKAGAGWWPGVQFGMRDKCNYRAP